MHKQGQFEWKGKGEVNFDRVTEIWQRICGTEFSKWEQADQPLAWGGGLTKVYFAKDVATKAFVSTSFAKYTFCKSPQASAVTPRWGNRLRFEMGNIDARFTPRFTSTVISYIKLVKKWGKNLKQSRFKSLAKWLRVGRPEWKSRLFSHNLFEALV